MNREDVNNNFRQIKAEAQAQGIPVPDNILPEVYINPRPKKRFGCCRKKDGLFTVEISEFILECSDASIKNVIAHELLHTCENSYDHGKKWKEYAYRMNKAYGYNIKRTSSFQEMGLSEPEGDRDNIRYIIKCRSCGKEYPRQKFTCVMKKINSYRCSCGGRLYVIDKCNEYNVKEKSKPE